MQILFFRQLHAQPYVCCDCGELLLWQFCPLCFWNITGVITGPHSWNTTLAKAWMGNQGFMLSMWPLSEDLIGMDLFGPLPQSARGHQYILMILAYAIRYSEALPLHNATTKSISREWVYLASRVGISSKIWMAFYVQNYAGLLYEVPQGSTEFSPFDLLCEQQPCSFLYKEGRKAGSNSHPPNVPW